MGRPETFCSKRKRANPQGESKNVRELFCLTDLKNGLLERAVRHFQENGYKIHLGKEEVCLKLREGSGEGIEEVEGF